MSCKNKEPDLNVLSHKNMFKQANTILLSPVPGSGSMSFLLFVVISPHILALCIRYLRIIEDYTMYITHIIHQHKLQQGNTLDLEDSLI